MGHEGVKDLEDSMGRETLWASIALIVPEPSSSSKGSTDSEPLGPSRDSVLGSSGGLSDPGPLEYGMEPVDPRSSETRGGSFAMATLGSLAIVEPTAVWKMSEASTASMT